MCVAVQTGGQLADLIRRKGLLSTTGTRKLFNCVGKVYLRWSKVFLTPYLGKTVKMSVRGLEFGLFEYFNIKRLSWKLSNVLSFSAVICWIFLWHSFKSFVHAMYVIISLFKVFWDQCIWFLQPINQKTDRKKIWFLCSHKNFSHLI